MTAERSHSKHVFVLVAKGQDMTVSFGSCEVLLECAADEQAQTSISWDPTYSQKAQQTRTAGYPLVFTNTELEKVIRAASCVLQKTRAIHNSSVSEILESTIKPHGQGLAFWPNIFPKAL